MTNHGDDCFFFYYSTCTKGDGCPFRHCEAAMGNETVCSLWEEGRCFRATCKFRHMEILKNRKAIPCYWETQPSGCQKPHCAFMHQKPRCSEGTFPPPSKSVKRTEEQQEEPPLPPPAANPQLRGVIKTETQELVPSPTHPPVVINPADDDEDEDDQFSEEGDDGRLGPSPRKRHRSGDSLNMAVSSLEEIRLRRTLKVGMRRSGYPAASTQAPANGGKENIQSFPPALWESTDVSSVMVDEGGPLRAAVASRLGGRRIQGPAVNRDGLLLKRSLARRLGGVVEEEEPEPPHKVSKPVRERLGLVPAAAAPMTSGERSQSAPEQLHIKTLEEIKQEKAWKAQSPPAPQASQGTPPSGSVPVPRQTQRSSSVRDSSSSQVKTSSQLVQARKQSQQDDGPESARRAQDRREPPDTAAPPEEVRVKTLEEIRREKATRQQVQPPAQTPSKEGVAKRPRLLRLRSAKLASEKTGHDAAKPLTPSAATAPSEAGSTVTVKSFEEIMREKRQRKQEERPPLKRRLPDPDPPQQASARQPRPASRSAPPSPPVPVESHSPPAPVASRNCVDPRGEKEEEPTNGGPMEAKPRPPPVRPRLNVRPSVVKPGQRRTGAEPSAVAAVRPLSSSSSPQGTASGHSQVLPSLGADAPLREELQTVPAKSPRQDAQPAVPQSPVLRSPAQPRARRPSMAASRSASSSSAVDDFDDLINELTDEHLEDDVDPGIGEDDLLQELSDMIDS